MAGIGLRCLLAPRPGYLRQRAWLWRIFKPDIVFRVRVHGLSPPEVCSLSCKQNKAVLYASAKAYLSYKTGGRHKE